MQLQDVHKWSFGRPDPKASKNHDEGGSEDIPLEGLDNGLAIQGSNGSHDRCVSVHMHWLTCPGMQQVAQAHKFAIRAEHHHGCSIAVACLSKVKFTPCNVDFSNAHRTMKGYATACSCTASVRQK